MSRRALSGKVMLVFWFVLKATSKTAPLNKENWPFSGSFCGFRIVIFFFPYNPHPPPPRQTPPAVPGSISVRFGSVWLRFGSVWLRLALFRLRFGSVSGPFRVRFGVLGGVGERGFCKGKEYHYFRIVLTSYNYLLEMTVKDSWGA